MTAVPNENIPAPPFAHDPCATKRFQPFQPSATTAPDPAGRRYDLAPDIILAVTGADPLFLQPPTAVQSPYLSEAAV